MSRALWTAILAGAQIQGNPETPYRSDANRIRRFTAGVFLWLLVLSSSALAQTTLTPSTLSFGNQVLNVASTAKTATLKNTQTVALTISSITISGGDATTDYASGGTCPISPNTLSAGKSCKINVTFTPSSLGSRTATLTVVHSASTSPQSVALTGTGIEPVTLSASSLSFGTVAVGNTASKSVTVTNHETTTLTFTNVGSTGDFAIASNTCGTSIAAGAKCTVGVAFSPTATGTQTGMLTFTDSAANSPQTASLSGTGSAPVTVSPLTLNFASRDVGTMSAAQTITLTNHLTASLNVSAPVASGDFAVASNTCGSSVGTGLKCSIGITFTPTAVGARSGTVTISYGAFGSPTVVNLTGTGNVTGLTSITVTPANPSVPLGYTQQFIATGNFKSGNTGNVTDAVTWTSSMPSVATINAIGLASALAEGQTTIQASSGAVSGSSTLTVTSDFVLTGSLNDARYQHTATLLNNGMVLIAGGVGDTGALASAELYNPATGTFTLTGNLNNARYAFAATLLNNGMVLIAGGLIQGGVLASAELYNPVTGTFIVTGSLNTARAIPTATLLNNGMVLIAGGHDSNNSELASAELYDPTTGTFTPTGSMNVARTDYTATLLNNGMVLMAGGDGSSGMLASAELYNPVTGTFTNTGSMNTARVQHAATLLNGGMVLIAGGDGPSAVLASAEIYNPVTGTFTLTGSMNTTRDIPQATLLNNGTVLITGGFDNSFNDLASAELYNPATATFTYTGSMNAARVQHTATLLDDGMVLIAGGEGPSGFLSSAELY